LTPTLPRSAPIDSPTRGRLQIITGASAGLTALRLVLEKARAAQEDGVDVIVGRVNFKSELVIINLLKDMECLPEIPSPLGPAYGSSVDVRSVQRRAPSVVVIDTSVPHEGGPGSASPNSDVYAPWKDIEMIVSSGIDVWASLDTSRLGHWVAAVSGQLRGDSELSQKIKLVQLGR
jgi:K+-sensing histidine kinase KdpD